MTGGSRGRRRDIARILLRLRLDAGKEIEEVAEHLDCPPSRVSHIENGSLAPRIAETRDMLDLYLAPEGTRTDLLDAVRRMKQNNWWYPYADLIDTDYETLLIMEDEARSLSTYQPNLVPGLLQTDRYAWELMITCSDRPLEQVDRQARLRTGRRRVLARDPAPSLVVILDEAALRRTVGDAEVMREQYERLIGVAAMPTATLQVMPLGAGALREVDLPFHLFEFDDAPPVVQLEFLNRVGLAQDTDEIEHYAAVLAEASRQAFDPASSLAFLRGLAGRSVR